MFEPDDLLVALTDANVEFVVIGGIAVGVHGFVRATKDLDIVPDAAPENLTRLANLLAEVDAQHAGLDDFSPDEFPYDPTDPVQLAEGANFRLETNHGPLDILQWVSGVEADPAYPDLMQQALTVRFRGTDIRVCGLEHLRAMKRAAGREQDLVDLRELPPPPAPC
jgi:predicted nucleotidyltransferase